MDLTGERVSIVMSAETGGRSRVTSSLRIDSSVLLDDRGNASGSGARSASPAVRALCLRGLNGLGGGRDRRGDRRNGESA